MLPRPIIIASLIGGAIGVPYLASRTSDGGKVAATPPSETSTTPTPIPLPPVSAEPSPSASSHSSKPAPLDPAPAKHPPSLAIEHVLRFDLTKEWVYRTWPRKSTGPTDVGLFGVRVPLVTGTQPSSLAGSLTYYFNTHGQVEHISFRGRTGDARPLVSFLTRTYQFERSEAPMEEQVYHVKRRGRVQSQLRARPEAVLKSASPHNNFAVELELARPGTRRFLPPRVPRLQIPQVANPPMSSTPDDLTADTGGNSYFDNVRYATPQERDQVLWKRWPN